MLGVFSVDVDVDVSASGRTVPVTTSRRLYCLFNFVSFYHLLYVCIYGSIRTDVITSSICSDSKNYVKI